MLYLFFIQGPPGPPGPNGPPRPTVREIYKGDKTERERGTFIQR